jgi:hypothetical protein
LLLGGERARATELVADSLGMPAYATNFCAPLRGEVEADRAWFAFDIQVYAFRAEVTASRDARRMAGEFFDVIGQRFKSSWLRVRDDERALRRRSCGGESALPSAPTKLSGPRRSRCRTPA